MRRTRRPGALPGLASGIGGGIEPRADPARPLGRIEPGADRPGRFGLRGRFPIASAPAARGSAMPPSWPGAGRGPARAATAPPAGWSCPPRWARSAPHCTPAPPAAHRATTGTPSAPPAARRRRAGAATAAAIPPSPWGRACPEPVEGGSGGGDRSEMTGSSFPFPVISTGAAQPRSGEIFPAQCVDPSAQSWTLTGKISPLRAPPAAPVDMTGLEARRSRGDSAAPGLSTPYAMVVVLSGRGRMSRQTRIGIRT